MPLIKKLIPLVVVSAVLIAIAVPILAQAQSPLPPDAIRVSPGINFENLLNYTPFQHGIVGHVLTLGYAAQAAGLVYFLATLNNIAPRYRLSSVLSAVVMVSAFLELLQLSLDWRSAFVYGDGLWRPTNDAFSNGFRYMNWSIDVPMLLIQLTVVLGLTRKQAFSYGTQFVIGGLLMIYTGYIGQFYEVTNPIPFWIWGAISTVFYIYVLAVVWRMLGKESRNMPKDPDNLEASMKNLRWYILITWSLYPIAYLMPVLWFSGWGVVARQIIYTVADITSKVIYGVILSYIAQKRSESLEYEPAIASSQR